MSGQTLVSQAIRDRVMCVVREVNYAPNVHARALAGGRSRTLGMIVSNIENPFLLGIVIALEEVATQQDFEVLVEHTGYRRERLVASIRSMLKRRVEGLAVIVSEMDRGLIEELAAQDVPVVFYDVGRPARNITSIRVRYDKGTQQSAEYLYSLGHRRFGFVAHHAGLGPLEERKRTFLDVMEKFGKGVHHGTASGMDSPGGGRHAAREMLSSPLRPTAILCANDHMAVGVLRELHERELPVPGKVSVVGYDNIALAEHLCPSLTTVRIPQRDIGQLVFEALVFGNGSNPRDIVIEPELIVRESSGPRRDRKAGNGAAKGEFRLRISSA